MTLTELQKILGDQIESVLTLEDCDSAEYQIVTNRADMISRLAKQMINNADVVLRTDKLLAEGKLSEVSTISSLVKHHG